MIFLRHLFLLFICALSVSVVTAQISHGGSPVSFIDQSISQRVPVIQMAPVHLDALIDEDIRDAHIKDKPWRFGANIPVDLNTDNSGKWEVLENGDRVWRLTIRSLGAYSLNFLFDKYNLQRGSKLFIYNADRTEVLGAFTSANNKENGMLGTTIIRGEQATIEYIVPARLKIASKVSISRVTHGYRDVWNYARTNLRGSGACQNNVICAIGDPWRDQIRSAAMVVVFGSGICSGAMLNNTCDDSRPYFFTANHCVGGGSVANWTFLFNYQSSDCNNDVNAPTNQAVSGAQVRANHSNSDFALLELSQIPPTSYNVYYAGWDARTILPSTPGVSIHHPSGDMKKISIASSITNQAPYWSTRWSDGVTEEGSSGSPLFNNDGRVIGSLCCGSSSCTNTSNRDLYGRMDLSWDAISGNSNQLMPWLDACSTGEVFIDGLGAGGPPPAPANDDCVAATTLQVAAEGQCASVTVQGTTANATIDGSAPVCDQSGSIQDVWYTFNSGNFGTINLELTANSSADLSYQLLGTCGGASIECQLGPGNYTIGNLTPNNTYLVRVWSNTNFGAAGSFDLCISGITPSSDNDICGDALPVVCGQTYTGTTATASANDEPTGICGTEAQAPGVWYTYVGGGDEVTLDLCASDFDTRVMVYSGDCNNLVCVGGNDDGPDCANFQSQFSFNSQNGVNYYFYVNGWNGNTGNVSLSVTCATPCSPVPANDECVNAVPLTIQATGSCNATAGTNVCAGVATQPTQCDQFGVIQDVWYSFNSGSDTTITFGMTPITADSLSFAIYTACGNPDVASVCRVIGDVPVSGFSPNTDYLLQVWTNGGAQEGTFEVCLTGTPQAPICAQPTAVVADNIGDNSASLTWVCDVAGLSHNIRGGIVGTNGVVELDRNGCGSPLNVNTLNPGTTYWWQVQTVCDASGEFVSDWSDIDTFTTTFQCDVPTTITTSNITSNSARLNWAAVAGANSYRVRGRSVGAANWTFATSNSNGLNTGSILQSGRTYEWQVESICSGGSSGYSVLTAFSTPAAKMNSNETIEDFNFELMPNPSAGRFRIQVNTLFEDTRISIYDLMGRTIVNEKLNSLSSSYDLKNQSKGIYLVTITKGDISVQKKLVIR